MNIDIDASDAVYLTDHYKEFDGDIMRLDWHYVCDYYIGIVYNTDGWTLILFLIF